MNFGNILFQVSVWTLPVLIAVTLHEAAHGWMAWKLGDDTAHRLGRVTFNPLSHVDPFGTIMLPAMLLLASGGSVMFGVAKPVPVNFRRLRRPRRDMVFVAAAGPAANLVIAVIAAALFHALPILSPDFGQWVGYNLRNAIWINVLLCVFNMIPIPPLDGGRVAVGLLPAPLSRSLARLERKGIFIVLGLVFIVPWIGGKLDMELDMFWWMVGEPAAYLMRSILSITGVM
ncbi:MAG: site-2 protease family protein [Rhodospirillales bacterium]|nr:site-2 protease family protein [Rhodospirillales bacterium]